MKRPEYTVLCEDWIEYCAKLEAVAEAVRNANVILDDVSQGAPFYIIETCDWEKIALAALEAEDDNANE